MLASARRMWGERTGDSRSWNGCVSVGFNFASYLFTPDFHFALSCKTKDASFSASVWREAATSLSQVGRRTLSWRAALIPHVRPVKGATFRVAPREQVPRICSLYLYGVGCAAGWGVANGELGMEVVSCQ